MLDPGPDGSLGDVSWLIAARRSGALPLLIVQGVLMTDLAAAADFVLPGAAYVEKDAIYTNDQGRVQAASRAIAPPGEAVEDWEILVNVGRSLGVALPFTSADGRAAGARRRDAGHAVRRGRPARFHAAGAGPKLAAGVEPLGAVEVGFPLPGPAAGQGPQRADGGDAAPGRLHSARSPSDVEENVTLLAAFGAGILSFISPCVLPLIPGYLSYLSGLSLDDMRGTTRPPAAASLWPWPPRRARDAR